MKKQMAEPVPALADERILDLYWERNEDAIAQTDRKYGKYLFRIAYNILDSQWDSEECQNDTYLRAWNAIPPTRPRVLQAFLVRILRNSAINKYKEMTRQKRVRSEMTVAFEELSHTLSTGNTSDRALQAAHLGRAISDFLDTRTKRQRYIFVARFYVGDKLEVIAAHLGLDPSTVHREVKRLQQDLKIYLEGEGIYV